MKFQAPQALMLAVGISRNGQVSLDPAMTDSSPETFWVVVERQFSHPPEKIWRALTQPQGVADEKRFSTGCGSPLQSECGLGCRRMPGSHGRTAQDALPIRRIP